eukprot:364613-Chlamydomonas_euryale.AAC.4
MLTVSAHGVPFVTAPCPLLDPLCHVTLNTGIPFVGLLSATLTLTLTLTIHTADPQDDLAALGRPVGTSKAYGPAAHVPLSSRTCC